MNVKFAYESTARSWYSGVIREGKPPYSKADKLHQPHDKGYQYLLSHKHNLVELLQGFVHESWVKQLDESQIERLDTSFILPNFKKQEADDVYRVSLKGNKVMYYVLLEFQSTVDYQMPIRLLFYMFSIWLYVLKDAGAKAKRKSYRLPVIIPIILYNGERPWTASRSFKDILDVHEEHGNGLLDFEYIVLDVNRYEKQLLIDNQNFMSSVLLLDQKSSVSEMLTRLKQIADLITSWDEPTVRMFSTWMKNIASRGLDADKQDEVNQLLDQMKPKEAKQMIYNLERTLKNAFKDATKEGELKGELKGELRGKLEGKLEVAKHMLHEGFDLDVILNVTKLTKDDMKDLNI